MQQTVRQLLGRCVGQHLEDAELPNVYATETLPKQKARYLYPTRNLHLSKFFIGDRPTYSAVSTLRSRRKISGKVLG